MLTLKRQDGKYWIDYRSVHAGQYAFQFYSDFLPEGIITHFSLIFNGHSERTFTLNRTQDESVTDVLHKLLDEDHTDYIFAEQLEKTYLVEFIHLATKIHYASLQYPV
jgi:hypothetical protein